MTDQYEKVDGSPVPSEADAGAALGLIASVSQIADRDGVSKQAVSKRVKTLVDDHGLAVERDGRGNIVGVNVAQYDHLRGLHGDPSKDQRPTAEPTQPAADSYDDALRRKTLYEAERRGLELGELYRKLIRAEELAQASADIGAQIAQTIGTLEGEADNYAATLMRDGPHGLRIALKQTIYRMRTEIADALSSLATLAEQKAEASGGS